MSVGVEAVPRRDVPDKVVHRPEAVIGAARLPAEGWVRAVRACRGDLRRARGEDRFDELARIWNGFSGSAGRPGVRPDHAHTQLPTHIHTSNPGPGWSSFLGPGYRATRCRPIAAAVRRHAAASYPTRPGGCLTFAGTGSRFKPAGPGGCGGFGVVPGRPPA